MAGVFQLLQSGADPEDCRSHKGGTGMGTRDRQEITTTDHHPRMSEGSPSVRTEGLSLLTLATLGGDADAGVIKQMSVGLVVEF